MQKMLLYILIMCAFLTFGLAAGAKESDPDIQLIAWDDAPDYIQTQIRNVVLNCTQGTLTPNKTKIYEYGVKGENAHHYILYFSAWKNQPLTPACTYGEHVCSHAGCLMMVYTHVQDNIWKSSLRTPVLGLEITHAQNDGKTIPLVEMTQDKFQCRIANGGSDTCKASFTWLDGVFRYYGYGINTPTSTAPASKE